MTSQNSRNAGLDSEDNYRRLTAELLESIKENLIQVLSSLKNALICRLIVEGFYCLTISNSPEKTLIVDEDKSVCSLFKRTLENAGYRVKMAKKQGRSPTES